MSRLAQDSVPLRRIKNMAIDSHTDGDYLNMAGFARAVLDALPDATAILDSSGTIIAVNRVWLMFALDNGGQSGDNWGRRQLLGGMRPRCRVWLHRCC